LGTLFEAADLILGETLLLNPLFVALYGFLAATIVAIAIYVLSRHDSDRYFSNLNRSIEKFVQNNPDHIDDIVVRTGTPRNVVEKVLDAFGTEIAEELVWDSIPDLLDEHRCVDKRHLYEKIREVAGPGVIPQAKQAIEALRTKGEVTFDGDLSSAERICFSVRPVRQKRIEGK
jgi:hypothetical protein